MSCVLWTHVVNDTCIDHVTELLAVGAAGALYLVLLLDDMATLEHYVSFMTLCGLHLIMFVSL